MTLTPEQWKNLPATERARLRAEKHRRWAMKRAERDAKRDAKRGGYGRGGGEGSGRGACCPAVEMNAAPDAGPNADQSPARNPRDTPFVRTDGQPIDLRGVCSTHGIPNFRPACFVVLAGPSLRQLDLSLLSRRGIWTIGVNNSPAIVRTNAWTIVDPPRKFHNAIWRDPAVLKIVPARFFDRTLREKVGCGGGDDEATGGQSDGPAAAATAQSTLRDLIGADRHPAKVRHMPNIIGYLRNANYRPEEFVSEPTINWGNSDKSARRNGRERCLNVMPAVIKIAYSLGFRDVYLLGCDFRMSDECPYAFQQTKCPGGVRGNNNAYSILNRWFADLRPRFEAAGLRVMNCNAASGLTVFDHVPYRKAIEAATVGIPQEPLDTNGWYE